jgi:hypothetical protein
MSPTAHRCRLLILPLCLWSCQGDKTDGLGSGGDGGSADDGGSTGDGGDSGDTGATSWTTLPADCTAPSDLLADPLTLEGQVRVTQTDGGGFMEALDVDLEGDIAWTVGMGYLLAFDVSDPAAPSKVHGPYSTSYNKLHKVEPLGPDAIATADREDGLTLWDTTEPADASVAYFIEGEGIEGLAWVGGYLYVSVRAEGVRVYNVDDISAPILVGSASGLSTPWELSATDDGWLYAADNTLGVVPIDIRAPTAPVIGTAVAVDGNALHVRVDGDRLYVAAGGAGVEVYDISTRDAPSLLWTLPTSGSSVMSAVADVRLWVADHEGVQVYDLTASPPTPIQMEETEQFALAIDAQGERGYVGDWNLFDIYKLDPSIAAPALDLSSDPLRLTDGQATSTVTNRGAGTLTLAGATVSTEGAVVEFSQTVLAPGDSATMRVTGGTAETTVCLASDDPSQPTRTIGLLESQAAPAGVTAPDFTLTGLDGLTYRLSDHLGSPVLLAYFATW